MKEIIVTNQAELDAIPSDFEGLIIIKGGTYIDPIIVRSARESSRVVAYGSSRVEAYESSRVVAYGSSRVEAYESSRVVAYGSSRVEAYGSSRVEARESSSVVAYGSSSVVAGTYSAIHKMPRHIGAITGGVVIAVPAINSAELWCAYHGVTVRDGVAIVYKAVRDDYRSGRGFLYLVGSAVEAGDWDGGTKECGGGLHFSPSPALALTFDGQATRFLECPVALSDIRAPREDDEYPQKIKARCTVGEIVEVDQWGEPVK